jgi:ABC-2 type transport system ATP-binding protein
VSDEAILLDGVTKAFGEVQALDGVDFQVGHGEVFGFLGPNGAGKTTTIRILTGFIKADSGQARVLGRDAWKDQVAVKRSLGFLPDVISFDGGFTGRGFLDYMAKLRGFRGTPPMRRQLLDRLELADAALDRKIKGYSTGMAKKLALIQAMQHDPAVLIMDEPAESLDPLMRKVLFGLFAELRERGTTIFMSSHVLSDVEDTCGRVALIRGGRIVSAGSLAELAKGRPRTVWVEFREAPADGLVMPGVEVISREGNSWRLAIAGDVNAIVRELARYDLADLVFERLSLEELFIGFYGTGSPEPERVQEA